MVLITSGAYASPALVSEFGKLPPSFLPVQNRRLFSHQLKLFDKEHGARFISLPKSFQIDEADRKELEKEGCNIIWVPDDFSLGQSIVYCLGMVASFEEPLYILHGDTLFEKITSSKDMFSVADPQYEYEWAQVREDENIDRNLVFSGFFSFSSQIQLIRSITELQYDFIKGLELYARRVSVENMILPSWLDFGLINSYFRSVSCFTTERAFNSLKASRFSITKRSRDKRKVLAEAHWLKNIPTEMKHYAPAVWNEGNGEEDAFYTLEYLYLSSLANLFVFGKNTIPTWKEIIQSCKDFIDEESKILPPDSEDIARKNERLFKEKTRKRLQQYCDDNDILMTEPMSCNGICIPSLKEILDDIEKDINVDTDRFVSLCHGDFCFSNILYDFKSKSIKVLDPRGIDIDGNETVYGDFRYDVAKLAHSVIGLYDLIIAGRYSCMQTSPYEYEINFEEEEKYRQLQEIFTGLKFGGYEIDELNTYPLMIGLFLSMLPLHSDRPDRQKAMLANALRLYIDYKKI